MEITIRLAGPDEAYAIASVHVRGWQSAYAGHLDADWLASLTAEAWSESWKPRMADPTRRGPLVAEIGNRVVGFASFGPVDEAFPMTADYGELYTLYVDPEFYSQGVGALLLDASEAELAELGYRHALLWCYDFNAGARRFYERHGWRCEGTLRSYEAGPDAIRYVRELGIEPAAD
jgi:GNAT superfamily N-acetyltransferase